jgi:hypothetical protein
MVTPRQFSTYDPMLQTLFLTAYERPITLDFPTELDAKRQRKQFYAFRDAIAYSKTAPENLKIVAKLLSFKLEGIKLIIYRPRYLKLEMKALGEAKEQQSKSKT